MTKVCELYWIRRECHTDITCEGYVGITTAGFISRKSSHLSKAKKGVNSPLYNAIRKYDDICYSVILVSTLEYCLEVENRLRPHQNIGYNICIGGGKNMAGYKHTDEFRRKISEANKRRGTVSDETKKLLSIASKGRIHSEDTRKRMSEIAKERGINPETFNRLQEGRKSCIFPWQQPVCNLELWKNATKVFDAMQKYPEYGIHNLSKVVTFTPSQLQVIYRNIKNGWNPYNCQEWQQTFNENLDTQVSILGE